MHPRPLAATVLLFLAGCAVTPPAGALPPTPAPTVTVTTFGDPADEPVDETTVEPSEEPTVEPTGWSGLDVADRSAGQHSAEADVVRWTLVDSLMAESSRAGKPVAARFDAIVRSATYESKRGLTLSFDRGKPNPKYEDGGNENYLLNPVKKWETLHSDDLLVLINPGDGGHQMPAADLPKYLKAETASVDHNTYWLTPFTFYYVGNKLVALDEWYVP